MMSTAPAVVGRFWDWPFIPGVALGADGREDLSSSSLSSPGTAGAWVFSSSPFSGNPVLRVDVCIADPNAV